MKKGLVGTLGFVLGAAGAAAGVNYCKDKELNQKNGKVDKFKGYYNMLNQWLMLKQQGHSLEKFFADNNYKSIAIYGMGEMGNRLYDELKDTGVEIKYAVDKNAATTYSELDVVDYDAAEFETVDCIVVTATFAFAEIDAELANKVDFPIVSLEDVVYES